MARHATSRPVAAWRRGLHLHVVAITGACVAGAGAEAGASPTTAPAVRQVRLAHIAFTPATLRIHRGDSVRWTWADPYVAHNLHSIGTPRFRGASDRQTGTHTVRFTRAGTYRYECTLHPGMRGRVIVGRG